MLNKNEINKQEAFDAFRKIWIEEITPYYNEEGNSNIVDYFNNDVIEKLLPLYVINDLSNGVDLVGDFVRFWNDKTIVPITIDNIICTINKPYKICKFPSKFSCLSKLYHKLPVLLISDCNQPDYFVYLRKELEIFNIEILTMCYCNETDIIKPDFGIIK
jgi:hypothetical protein